MKNLLRKFTQLTSVNYFESIPQPSLIGKTIVTRKSANDLNMTFKTFNGNNNLYLQKGDELIILRIDEGNIHTDKLTLPIISNVFNSHYFMVKNNIVIKALSKSIDNLGYTLKLYNFYMECLFLKKKVYTLKFTVDVYQQDKFCYNNIRVEIA